MTRHAGPDGRTGPLYHTGGALSAPHGAMPAVAVRLDVLAAPVVAFGLGSGALLLDVLRSAVIRHQTGQMNRK
eukprot:401269-Pyramimonas_sp.AAC.1